MVTYPEPRPTYQYLYPIGPSPYPDYYPSGQETATTLPTVSIPIGKTPIKVKPVPSSLGPIHGSYATAPIDTPSAKIPAPQQAIDVAKEDIVQMAEDADLFKQKPPTEVPKPVIGPEYLRERGVPGQPEQETRVYEPPPIKIPGREREGPPQSELTYGYRVERAPPERPDILDQVGLTQVEETLGSLGRQVSKTAGFEMYPKFPLEAEEQRGYFLASPGKDDPISAIGRGVSEVPVAIAGTPRFVRDLLTRPAETGGAIVKAGMERPVETTVTGLLTAGVFRRVGARVRTPKYKVTKLQAIKEEKFVGIGFGEGETTAIAQAVSKPLLAKTVEKTKPAIEPYELAEAKGSPLTQAIKLFSEEGKAVGFFGYEQRLFHPVKTGPEPGAFKIPKAKVSPETIRKIADLEAKGPRNIPGLLAPYPKEPPRTIPPAPRPVRPGLKVKVKPRPGPALGEGVVIEAEAMQATTPKAFARMMGGATAMTQAVRAGDLQKQILQARQRLKPKQRTEPVLKADRLPTTVPAPPIVIVGQDLVQRQKRLTSQLLVPRLSTPQLVRSGVPSKPGTGWTLFPTPPAGSSAKRARALLSLGKKKKGRKLGTARVPRAFLRPKGLGLPDLVSGGIGIKQSIGAFGMFKKRRKKRR